MIQDHYQKAIRFAAEKHGAKNQIVPGTDLPYLMHLSTVAMEILLAPSHSFNMEFAIQVALLHDTIEDTDTSFEELERIFSREVAEAVAALTKTEGLPSDQKMRDSLERIKMLSHEVWAVKLADRITNLQPPPAHWDREKRLKYKKESEVILSALAGGHAYLERRRAEKIEAYDQYCT